jgi:hypothetical protein
MRAGTMLQSSVSLMRASSCACSQEGTARHELTAEHPCEWSSQTYELSSNAQT